MRIFTQSVLCILFSFMPWIIFSWIESSDFDHKDYHYPISLILGLIAFVFTFYTYRSLLRFYGERRRKILVTDLGITSCPVIPQFNMIKKQQLRTRYGLTPTIQHSQPPPLPTHSERDATSSHDALSEKLKTLQKMKIDGLITEQEYDEKKSEILNRF